MSSSELLPLPASTSFFGLPRFAERLERGAGSLSGVHHPVQQQLHRKPLASDHHPLILDHPLVGVRRGSGAAKALAANMADEGELFGAAKIKWLFTNVETGDKVASGALLKDASTARPRFLLVLAIPGPGPPPFARA